MTPWLWYVPTCQVAIIVLCDGSWGVPWTWQDTRGVCYGHDAMVVVCAVVITPWSWGVARSWRNGRGVCRNNDAMIMVCDVVMTTWSWCVPCRPVSWPLLYRYVNWKNRTTVDVKKPTSYTFEIFVSQASHLIQCQLSASTGSSRWPLTWAGVHLRLVHSNEYWSLESKFLMILRIFYLHNYWAWTNVQIKIIEPLYKFSWMHVDDGGGELVVTSVLSTHLPCPR